MKTKQIIVISSLTIITCIIIAIIKTLIDTTRGISNYAQYHIK